MLTLLDGLGDGDDDFEDVAAPPMTVPTDRPVSEPIDQFRAEQQNLAVGVGNGRVVGLVAATDAFEAIAGGLEDPVAARRPGRADSRGAVRPRGDGATVCFFPSSAVSTSP